MIAPLAVCYAVEEAAGIIPDVKWPNDVQVEGKKLAGILIETSFDEGVGAEAAFVLVGTGINVNLDVRHFDEIRDLVTRYGVKRVECVDNILDNRYISTVFPKLAESGLGVRLHSLPDCGESDFSRSQPLAS